VPQPLLLLGRPSSALAPTSKPATETANTRRILRLLVRREDRIEGRIGLGGVCRGLTHQVANLRRKRSDGIRVVALNRGRQRLMSLPETAHDGLIGGLCRGKDGGGL